MNNANVVGIEYDSYPALDLFLDSDAWIQLLMGGWGTHKTTAGAIKAFRYMMIEDVKEDVLGRQVAHHNALAMAPTVDMARDVMIPEIFKWWPEQAIKKYDAERNIITTYYDQLLYIRSADKPFRAWGLNNIGFVWLDECWQMKKEVFRTVKSRVFRDGITRPRIIMTTNPWWNWLAELKEEPGKLEIFNVGLYDMPNANDEYIKELEKDLTPRQQQLYIHGKLAKVEGIIFPEYTPERHECTYNDFVNATGYGTQRQNLVFGVGIDWGFTHPFAAIYVAIDEEGIHWVYREVFEKGKVVTWLAEKLLNIEKEHANEKIKIRVADSEDAGSIALFNQLKVPTVRAKKLGQDALFPMSIKLAGINRVNILIESDKLKICKDKAPNLAREIPIYHWREFKDEDAHRVSEPSGKDDDAVSALRYFVNVGIKGPMSKSMKAENEWDRLFDMEMEQDRFTNIRDYYFQSEGVRTWN